MTFADLVVLIRRGQRYSKEWKADWMEFCDKKGMGTDPGIMKEGTLKEFIDGEKSKFAEASWYSQPMKSIELINLGQTKSEKFLKAWLEHAKTEIRDPARASGDVVKSFIDKTKGEYSKEDWWKQVEARVATVGSAKAGIINAGQKKSPEWKRLWAEYSEKKDLPRDPFRVEASVVDAFVKEHEPTFKSETWYKLATGEIDAAQARVLYSTLGAEPRKKMANTEIKDMDERMLIQKTKESMALSEDFKEKWYAYCDKHCEGIREPKKHPKENMIYFFTKLAPEVDTSVMGARSVKREKKEAGGDSGMMRGPLAESMETLDFVVVVSGAPMKAKMVDLVKCFEKCGEIIAVECIEGGGRVTLTGVPKKVSEMEHKVAGEMVQIKIKKTGS